MSVSTWPLVIGHAIWSAGELGAVLGFLDIGVDWFTGQSKSSYGSYCYYYY